LSYAGDLGGYSANPGSSACFATAKSYLDGFDTPYSLVAGNHDLEGLKEFDSDAENLAAWQAAFDMDAPCWSKEVAHKTLLVGLR
jgi:3',5'-cyclic AMP phosphodiesterase CpdA